MPLADLNADERAALKKVNDQLTKDLLHGLRELFGTLDRRNFRLRGPEVGHAISGLEKLTRPNEKLPGWRGSTIRASVFKRLVQGEKPTPKQLMAMVDNL